MVSVIDDFEVVVGAGNVSPKLRNIRDFRVKIGRALANQQRPPEALRAFLEEIDPVDDGSGQIDSG